MPIQDGQRLFWTAIDVSATLPARDDGGHKGTFGTALLLASTRDMPGAALMAGLGAMRSGVGKLEIGTDPEVINGVVSALPESIYLREGLKKVGAGEVELERYRAIAAGPGVHPDDVTEKAVQALLASPCPLVLDAGALSMRSYPKRHAPIILTPHPLEFSRITGITKEDLAENRVFHAVSFAKKWGVAIVLKGNHTIIAFPDGDVRINPTGNAALSKGGTGDTLAGMILGMLCCHDNWRHAVLNAVYLHGACADKWVETRSAHTMLAHEITSLLPEVWKSFER